MALSGQRDTGDIPSGKLCERFTAEARPARPEEDERLSALAQSCERGLGVGNVSIFVGDAQKRELAAAIIFLQRFDVRGDAVEPRRICRRREAVLAYRPFKASVDALMKRT